MARVEGDQALYDEVLTSFLRQGPSLLQRMRDAASSNDASKIERAAHALQGALRTVSCSEGALAAEALEEQGRKGDVSRTPELMLQLERAWERISVALKH